MKLHKRTVEENEHDFEVENKRASKDDEKVVEAMQKILTTYKGRQLDLARNVFDLRASDAEKKKENVDRALYKIGDESHSKGGLIQFRIHVWKKHIRISHIRTYE
ncbi:hypothetical protein L1987_61397 [Smallanthus sonchifolius]|uniref:Uncharacterized protein n=1 Tax=Smallanthus sonchifolius TaxID=185202 RepID=A0ACB9C7M2_9ASTR|nr:hypothetical protein L1987_61397 [Smallanthus sonchifolius]